MSEGSRDGHSKESKKQQNKPAQDFKQVQEPAGDFADISGITADPLALNALVVDGRLSAIQRQQAASQIGRQSGNAYLANLLRGQGAVSPTPNTATVQRDDEPPVGRGQSEPFGTFWIVPDDTFESFAGVEGEQITESAFAILEGVWSSLQSDSGNLRITETDADGNVHAGFKANMMTQIGMLMSQPTGRGIVVSLMSGSTSRVTIRPTSANVYGGGNAIRSDGANALEQASGDAGSGSGTIIQIDASLQDDDVMVFDSEGNEISLPVFVTLGHEMIHAQHNRAGRNRREQDATDDDYTNREEEETIGTGPTTENDIRGEHGLTARHGHAGRDTRPGM